MSCVSMTTPAWTSRADPGSTRRPIDRPRVQHIPGHDLDEVALQVSGRVPHEEPHFEPARPQQAHDPGAQRPGPAGYQDHRPATCSGIAPNCCIRSSVSVTRQCSRILPPDTRSTVMLSILTRRRVGR